MPVTIRGLAFASVVLLTFVTLAAAAAPDGTSTPVAKVAAAAGSPPAAGSAPTSAPAAGPASAPAPRPLTELPYSPSLDPAAMDRSVDPCVDLYTFSCGGWMKNNPIPPDQASWGVYGKLHDENQQYLWGILQEASAPDPSRSPNRQKIGDYFAACMDEAAIERAGAAPLQAELKAIEALTGAEEIPALLGRLHRADGRERDVRLQRGPGPQGFGPRDRVGVRGRSRHARPRLLREAGLPLLRDPQALPRARAEAAHPRGRRAPRRRPGGEADHEAREGPGEGLADARRAAGPVQDLPHDEGGRAAGADALVPLEGVPRGAGRARRHGGERHRAGLLQGAAVAASEDLALRLEGVPALAPRRRPGPVPLRRLRRGELRLQPPVPPGREGDRPALEAVRRLGGSRPRRGARPGLRREDLPARDEGEGARHGAADREGDGRPGPRPWRG